MCRLTVGIVVYKTPIAEIERLLHSLQKDDAVLRWSVVDNGCSKELQAAVESLGGHYLSTGMNEGFGKAHNLVLRSLSDTTAEYHLILNPDISFDSDTLRRAMAVMDSYPDVGALMPKVFYPDGSVQYLCKLLPSPIDLILRRFMPGVLKHLTRKRIKGYELRNMDYNSPAYVPSLSGCFLLVRRSVLGTVGGFDERFFLYMEDVDICRRIGAVSRLLYWPGITITHAYQMGSYRKNKLLWLHIRSAIKYFNKWGWFHDPGRDVLNAQSDSVQGIR